MPGCKPPSTRTEPSSTLTRRFFPVASGESSNSAATSLEDFFNMYLPSSFIHSVVGLRPTWTGESVRPYDPCSINLRQLRQHIAGLRPDVWVLIILRELLQNNPHAAVDAARLEQMQGLGAKAGIGIVHESLEHSIADAHIILHVRPQSPQRLQPHAWIRVIAQSREKYLTNMGIVRVLRQKVHGIHAHTRVVVVTRGEKQKLLDTPIVQRTLRLLGGNRVVLDADLVGAGFLGDGTDTRN